MNLYPTFDFVILCAKVTKLVKTLRLSTITMQIFIVVEASNLYYEVSVTKIVNPRYERNDGGFALFGRQWKDGR